MAAPGIPTGTSSGTPPHYSDFPGAVINTQVKFDFQITSLAWGRRRAEWEWKTEVKDVCQAASRHPGRKAGPGLGAALAQALQGLLTDEPWVSQSE